MQTQWHSNFLKIQKILSDIIDMGLLHLKLPNLINGIGILIGSIWEEKIF